MRYTEIFALSAAFLFLQGDPERDGSGGVPVPGGVVDSATQVAYLGDVGRGVVAIHTSDGNCAGRAGRLPDPWRCKGGGWPR